MEQEPQCFRCIKRDTCMPGYDDETMQRGADNGDVPVGDECNIFVAAEPGYVQVIEFFTRPPFVHVVGELDPAYAEIAKRRVGEALANE